VSRWPVLLKVPVLPAAKAIALPPEPSQGAFGVDIMPIPSTMIPTISAFTKPSLIEYGRFYANLGAGLLFWRRTTL
jgi:hypothetical protein